MKMSSQIFTFNIFFRLENSIYFMKHDAEVQIFYSDRNHYISQEISNTACDCKPSWWNLIFCFEISLDYQNLEV